MHITEYTANVVNEEAEAARPEKGSHQYRYLVWVPLLNAFQEMVQSFNRYAAQVKWNAIDQLIVAATELEHDPLDRRLRIEALRMPSNNTKYKRLLFAILPPVLSPECRPTAREWLDAHFSKDGQQETPTRTRTACELSLIHI